MKKHMLLTVAAFLLSVMVSVPVRQAAHAQDITSKKNFVQPIVFQAAGPTRESIQGTVDEYRSFGLGDPDNKSNAGQSTPIGRREINWDGGNDTIQTTSVAGNPSAVFQVTRGALFTTPNGTGFVQAPPAADPMQFPPGGLAGQFKNPTYATIFQAFSLRRLFSAIGSNTTDVTFFVPGPNNSNMRATVTGFGAVFTDVDQPDGNGSCRGSTQIEYFGTDGKLLFSSFVPASPGNGGLSFFGIVFPDDDARIARVRITSGNAAPGPDDEGKRDIVMMDDFIYGEPHALH